MKKKAAIYLAGSIQKGHERNDAQWTEGHRDLLRQSLPEFDLSFLNPDLRTDDLSDQKSVFGRDMLQVFCSDLVFVDARDRRGLGVGAEMMWAKANGRPVLIWAPEDSHYRKKETAILGVPVKNWVHPFVESLADGIVADLKEGAEWIRNHLANGARFKDLEFVREAMGYYKKMQLDTDAPMKELLYACQILKSRVEA